MKKKTNLFILTLLILGQSCAVYQKTPVSLENAHDSGQVKVVSKEGNKMGFKNIFLENSTYYGERLNPNKANIPIDSNSIESIYLRKNLVANNVIYSSLSGYMMTESAISFNYDRKLYKSLWVTTGIGKYPLLGDAFKVDLKLTALTGKRSSHLELGLGILYGRTKAIEERYVPHYNLTLPYKPPESYFYPAFTIGYRYQNPKGGIVLRTGIGFYEANIGIGFNF